jgi:hypothetical protein
MKVRAIKKSLKIRRKRKDSEVFPTVDEVTEGSLQVWRTLPEKIRQDPSLATFRQEHERLHGAPADDDPLPNDEHSDDGHSHSKNDLVSVNVTNELGQTKPHLLNGDHQEDHDITDMHQHLGHHQQNKYVKWCKTIVLLIAWLMFTLFLMSKNEKVLHYRQLAIPKENNTKTYVLGEVPVDPIIGLIFRGSFLNEHYDTNSTNKMFYFLSIKHHKDGTIENITDADNFAHLPVVTIPEMDSVKELKRSTTINLDYPVYQKLKDKSSELRLNLITNFDASLPVNFAYDPSPLDQKMGLIYATIVLLGLYVMIIWELVHRTFAAIIASTMSIGFSLQ